jgi:polyisoprenoid-binding protein YceI
VGLALAMEIPMKNSLAILSISSALIAPVLAADSYTIDPESSMPHFEIARVGFSTQFGRFDKADGKVTLDFSAKTGSVDFTIHTASIDMGSAAWTSHLSDPGLFNVKKFPTMTFKSDKLIFEGNKVVAAEGQFTMIGVTKPLKVAVDNFQCGISPANKKHVCSGNISATVKRSEFGLTKYIPAVGDEVKITVPVDAYKN